MKGWSKLLTCFRQNYKEPDERSHECQECHYCAQTKFQDISQHTLYRWACIRRQIHRVEEDMSINYWLRGLRLKVLIASDWIQIADVQTRCWFCHPLTDANGWRLWKCWVEPSWGENVRFIFLFEIDQIGVKKIKKEISTKASLMQRTSPTHSCYGAIIIILREGGAVVRQQGPGFNCCWGLGAFLCGVRMFSLCQCETRNWPSTFVAVYFYVSPTRSPRNYRTRDTRVIKRRKRNDKVTRKSEMIEDR